MMRMQERYRAQAVPALIKAFGYSQVLAVPRLLKVVINVGLSAKNKEPQRLEVVEDTLARITGQRPIKTVAKKSISNFKVRQGMTVGLTVTLRGRRMYDFLEKLVAFTFPRVRDFRGIPKSSVDQRGNLSIGFREHLAFPEIRPDEVERVHGLEVAVVTNAKNRAAGLALLTELGFPFVK